jgi:hypothetical protein
MNARVVDPFVTCKRGPGDPNQVCKLHDVHGAEGARNCIERSHADHRSQFPDIEELPRAALLG